MLRSQHYCFVGIFPSHLHHFPFLEHIIGLCQSTVRTELWGGLGNRLLSQHWDCTRTSGNRKTQVEMAVSFGLVWEKRSESQQDKNSIQVCKGQSLFSWSLVRLFVLCGWKNPPKCISGMLKLLWWCMWLSSASWGEVRGLECRAKSLHVPCALYLHRVLFFWELRQV